MAVVADGASMTHVIDLRGDTDTEALVEAIHRAVMRSRCDMPRVVFALAFATNCALAEMSDEDHQGFAAAVCQALLRDAGIPIDPVLH